MKRKHSLSNFIDCNSRAKAWLRMNPRKLLFVPLKCKQFLYYLIINQDSHILNKANAVLKEYLIRFGTP
jgi:hypothetical protein